MKIKIEMYQNRYISILPEIFDNHPNRVYYTNKRALAQQGGLAP